MINDVYDERYRPNTEKKTIAECWDNPCDPVSFASRVAPTKLGEKLIFIFNNILGPNPLTA